MSDWNPARDALLRKLWAEGKTGRQIGVLMGVTRNAVIGRVHRLKLNKRPSPIRTKDPAATNAKRRASVKAAERPASAINVKPTAQLNGHTVVQPVSKQNGHAAVQPAAVSVVKPGGFATCQWLEGEARLRQFCGAPTQAGSSYCPSHHERCWRKHQDVMKARAAE